MDRSLLMNAFLPASGVEDPFRFAGRKEEVQEIADALRTTGSIPLLYGHRGLGKSSLALQMSRIAQGDPTLLDQLEVPHLSLSESERFLSFYVNCSDGTGDVEGILQLLINSVESLMAQRQSEERPDQEKLVDRTTKRGISLKFFQHETTRRFEQKRSAVDQAALSREEKLTKLSEALVDTYGQKVLFVVDEVDRVRTTSGFASFLKSYSSEYVKFALVGIGSTEGDLLRDHASLNRQLVPIHLSKMASDELKSIVVRTTAFLAENDIEFRFAEGATAELARVASGFPWFVHLIGQATLRKVYDEGRFEATRRDVSDMTMQLPRNRFAKQFNDLYFKAVKDSYAREVVMRLFAEWRSDEIPTSEIYQKADRLGVSSPSTYVGHLRNADYGEILSQSPQQARIYHFNDEMFKTYVRMRRSIFEEVDRRVRATFGR